MKTVGLTGGIASGKSTVAAMFRDNHGVPVIDADQASRDIVAPGGEALRAIQTAFGTSVLLADGTLDRAGLRSIIMGDAQARTTLEGITHPAIRARIAEQLMELAAKGTALTMVEAALLVETGGYKLYPALIVVSCSPEAQITRVMARDGVSETQARQTLSVQLPLAQKEAVATHIIQNEGNLEALAHRVAEVFNAIST